MLSFRDGVRGVLGWAAVLAMSGLAVASEEPRTVTWRLEDVKRIGGHATEVIGAPVVVDGAVVFDGAKDGVFVPAIPLAGAPKFTIEILFRPAEGGPEAQRFFHLQDAATWRVMIETRLDGHGGWWLDTYLGSSKGGQPLIDPKRVHRTDQWYWAAVSYDGTTMIHYINGQKELAANNVAFGPLGEGKVSLGVRQNKVYWFKGAIKEVRFTPAALPAGKLQRVQ